MTADLKKSSQRHHWWLIYVALDPETHRYAFFIHNTSEEGIYTDLSINSDRLEEAAVLAALESRSLSRHRAEEDVHIIMICSTVAESDWPNDDSDSIQAVIEARKLFVGIVYLEPTFNKAAELL